MQRRAFITKGAVAALAGAVLSACSRAAGSGSVGEGPSSVVGSWGGTVLQIDEGELLVSGRRRAPMRIKVDSTVATGATMSMLISEVAPGAEIPVHLHRNEDELIFVHTGSGVVT